MENAPEAASFHRGQYGTNGVKGRRLVDRDDLVPFFQGEFVDRGDILDAGIVDEHIDRSELAFGIRYHRRNLRRLRHVGWRIEYLYLELAGDSCAFTRDTGCGPETVDHDIHALGCKGSCNAQPDTAGGSGDDCYPLLA